MLWFAVKDTEKKVLDINYQCIVMEDTLLSLLLDIIPPSNSISN